MNRKLLADTVLGSFDSDSSLLISKCAAQVINATGPFSDSIRHMSEPEAPKMIMASAGVHVTLPDYYSPDHLGMIVPKTKDGRVVFMLPWLEATIAGTTGECRKFVLAHFLANFQRAKELQTFHVGIHLWHVQASLVHLVWCIKV